MPKVSYKPPTHADDTAPAPVPDASSEAPPAAASPKLATLTTLATLPTPDGAAPATEAPADDIALIRRLLAGDEQAFVQLVNQLHAPMLRLARTITGPEGAQEVTQDTWEAVLDGIARFEGRSSLKTWVFRILTNRARTWATREKRFTPFSSLEDADLGREPAVDPTRFTAEGDWVAPPVPWTAQSPEALLLRKETGTALAREIDALTPGQRAVITLRDVEGCTSEEVCEILGITEVNQRVLLHRGRSKLRSAMERYLTTE